MATSFLHGAEVVEDDSGSRPFSVAPTGIIGIVGTAPFADENAFPLDTPVLISGSEAEAAKLMTQDLSELDEADLTSEKIGTLPVALADILQQGPARVVVVRVEAAFEPGPAIIESGSEPFALSDGQTLLVSVNGEPAATATFETADFADISEATAAEVAAVLATDLAVGVTISNADGKARITTTDTGEAASLEVTGGTAVAELGFPSAEVTGVEELYDPTQTLAAVVGGIDPENGTYRGITALLGAEAATGQKPKILLATGFSTEPTVITALGTVAPRLRACVVLDGPNTTDAAALAAAAAESDRRFYMVDPHVVATTPSWGIATLGTVLDGPSSAKAAGVIAATDAEIGPWRSPSNRPIRGVVATYRPVDFSMGDPNSRANILNEGNVATIIRQDGWRLWGNRTLSSDSRWAFLPVVRVTDMIDEALLANHLWAVDRGITKTYLEDVAEGVNAFLANLRTEGAIINGTCWPDPDLNTPDQIAQGRAYWNFDVGYVYPAERLTFRRRVNDDYLEELI